MDTIDGRVCRKSATQPTVKISATGGTGSVYTFDYKKNGVEQASIKSDSTGERELTNKTERTGVYEYELSKVTDEVGCYSNVSIRREVEIVELPSADFKINTTNATVFEPTIEIENTSLNGETYTWDFGDSTAMIDNNILVSHTYKDSATYTITLIASKDICKDTTIQTVRVQLPKLVYVPSAFSPNGDNVNDEFKISGDGIEQFEMSIYDRWGNLIFYSDDINKGWDGKIKGSEIAQIDAYVYTITIKSTETKQDYNYKGVISLVK
jgi:gliding motility-associated-like protein